MYHVFYSLQRGMRVNVLPCFASTLTCSTCQHALCAYAPTCFTFQRESFLCTNMLCMPPWWLRDQLNLKIIDNFSILRFCKINVCLLFEQNMEMWYDSSGIHSSFYKHTGKLGWSPICLRFSQFEPEIMLDGMLNFKTHFMVWYCFWYEHCNSLF